MIPTHSIRKPLRSITAGVNHMKGDCTTAAAAAVPAADTLALACAVLLLFVVYCCRCFGSLPSLERRRGVPVHTLLGGGHK